MTKLWAITDSTGLVVNVTSADVPLPHTGGEWVDITDVSPRPWLDWTYANGTFTPPVPKPTPAKMPEVVISKVRFEAVFAYAIGDITYETVLATLTQIAATNPITADSAKVRRAKRALDQATEIFYPVTDWHTVNGQTPTGDLTAEFLKIVHDILIGTMPDIGDKIDAGLAAWPMV